MSKLDQLNESLEFARITKNYYLYSRLQDKINEEKTKLWLNKPEEANEKDQGEKRICQLLQSLLEYLNNTPKRLKKNAKR